MSVALLFLGFFIIAAIVSWLRHLNRLRTHFGLRRTEFITQFHLTAPPEIAGAVYDHFQRMGVWKSFCPAPSDSLERTYKTEDEDVDDALNEILKQLGYNMPDSAVLGEWDKPLETLADVIEWLDWAVAKQQESRTTPPSPGIEREGLT